jgi:predicted glycoside hydrolase/deacetylase ChbG (UPF0249 family)
VTDRTGTPLIVTADDYGLTEATSRAILRAHREGVVTATSVLVVAPGCGERLEWLRNEPGIAVGVHLALVGEDPPVLTAHEVPTLVDGRGRFASSWRTLLPRLATGSVDVHDIRRELDAQIALVADAVPVMHLDSHQHVHLWPTVAAVVVELARDYGVGRVRVPRPTRRGARRRGTAGLATRLEHRLAVAEIASTMRFRGLDEAGHWTERTLSATVADLAHGEGSVEINTHPGAPDDDERHRYRWDYGWGGELEALCDPALRRQIDASGFALTGSLEP